MSNVYQLEPPTQGKARTCRCAQRPMPLCAAASRAH
jgi:hypothetical protein